MELNWIKMSPSLNKGISIINTLEEAKFDQFLKRIVLKLKVQESENVFSEEEYKKLENIFKIEADKLLLAIKTIMYIFKKMFKYIFMPIDLTTDLTQIGLNEEKADTFVKIWSAETSNTLTELTVNKGDQFDDNPDFSWKLNAELSSIYHKKCKMPKAYLKIIGIKNLEVELTHTELQSIFLQIESVQNEIDNLILH